MNAILEILILSFVVFIISSLIGLVKLWIGLFFGLTGLSLCVLLYYVKNKKTPVIDDAEKSLLQNQVKFYDFVFKALTVFLALAALMFYKDRQDMKDKINEDYSKLSTNLNVKAESLITAVRNEIQPSLNEAKKSRVILDNSTREAIAASQNANSESRKLQGLREEATNWIYSQKIRKKAGMLERTNIEYCDQNDTIKDDRWYNNVGVDYARRYMDEDAIKNFEKALNINPNNKQTLTNIIPCYMAGYQTVKACSISNVLVEKYPEDPQTFILRAMCDRGRPQDSIIKDIKQALNLGYNDYSLIKKEFYDLPGIDSLLK